MRRLLYGPMIAMILQKETTNHGSSSIRASGKQSSLEARKKNLRKRKILHLACLCDVHEFETVLAYAMNLSRGYKVVFCTLISVDVIFRNSQPRSILFGGRRGSQQLPVAKADKYRTEGDGVSSCCSIQHMKTATAICMSLEQHVVSSNATIHLGSATRNPITDSSRRSTSSSKSFQPNLKSGMKSISSKYNNAGENIVNYKTREKKSSGQATEKKTSASLVHAVRKRNCIRPSAYFTPGSKSYMLAKNQSNSSHSERDLPSVPIETKNLTDPKAGGKPVKTSVLLNGTPLFVPSSDKCYSPFHPDSYQVLVVRVSLHCKGCAGKVKKHISKMQGVTSFDVNFDEKKVTVVGDLTLLELLACISKVRTAQLLPPEMPNDVKQVIEEIMKT